MVRHGCRRSTLPLGIRIRGMHLGRRFQRENAVRGAIERKCA